MAFTSGASRMRARAPGESLSIPLDRAEDWDEPEKPRRDWTKIVLIFGLASLSWVATYVGMLELIQSNMGSLPITHKVITEHGGQIEVESALGHGSRFIVHLPV